MTEPTQAVIQHMNRQALYGDPPLCNWQSPTGQMCALEQHTGDVHVTEPKTHWPLYLYTQPITTDRGIGTITFKVHYNISAPSTTEPNQR